MLPPLVLALFACSGSGLEACDEPACRRDWALATWAGDAEAVLAAVREMDPVDQMVVVQALAEAHPGTSAELCEVLPEGVTRRRCEAINARPHLRVAATTTSVDNPGALAAEGPIASPFQGLPAELADCPDEAARNTCQAAAASAYAREGRGQSAAAACLGIGEDHWADECIFEAADEGLRGDNLQLGDVSELCLGSGRFARSCLAHVAEDIARSAPAADTAATDAWVALAADVEAASKPLRSFAPELEDALVARTWAAATALSYADVRAVTGHPLDAVPEVAVPHVRAAAALRLQELSSGGLDVQLAALTEALADRTPGAGGAVGRDPVRPRGDVEQLDSEELTLTTWVWTQQRAVSDDPVIDLTICLVEAAGRAGPKGDALLRAALDHGDPLVRWSAVKLLADRKGARSLLAKAARDPHALVRRRAEHELAALEGAPR